MNFSTYIDEEARFPSDMLFHNLSLTNLGKHQEAMMFLLLWQHLCCHTAKKKNKKKKLLGDTESTLSASQEGKLCFRHAASGGTFEHVSNVIHEKCQHGVPVREHQRKQWK